jgi:S1-C subfamily serine protease
VSVLSPAPPKNGREQAEVRTARRVAYDPGSDLAVLKIDGPPLPPLRLRDSTTVREGQPVLMTGFPIGSVLGPYPATHRGMVAAITPIAIPQPRAAQLDAPTLHRLATGTFPVFQLDATAYPGNSGSPIYDPDTGEVIGIVNMVLVKGTRESALKDPTGITYAIPASHVQALLEQLR